jgi:archaellum component FlaC
METAQQVAIIKAIVKKEFFIKELESLQRTLDFIQEEQAFVKQKITHYLDIFEEASWIEWAEEMQQQILNREAALHLLKKDIQKLKGRKLVDIVEVKKQKQQLNYLENEFLTWKQVIDQKLDTVATLDN